MREAEAGSRQRLIVIVAGISANQAVATAVAGLDDATRRGERSKALIEGGGADAAVRAQLGEGDRGSGGGERRRDALIDRAWHGHRRFAALDELEGEGLSRFNELDLHRLQRWGGTVLNGEGQGVSVTAQIEVAVTPGVELGGAAQRLAGTDVAGTLL